MSDAPDTLIASFDKNSREAVRVSLGTFQRHQLAHVRVWTKGDGDKDPVPTKKGLSIQAALLPALRAALNDAETEARRLGWISEDGGNG